MLILGEAQYAPSARSDESFYSVPRAPDMSLVAAAAVPPMAFAAT
jgi:hypothetical protein